MSVTRSLNTATEFSTDNDRERKARLIWATVIIGLLATQICMSLFAVFMATHTESLSIVPDYYNKAMDWDDEQNILKASEKLNWQTDIQAGPEIDIYGNRVLSIRVSDEDGKAIELDSISIDLFHHAHAGNIFQPELEKVTDGFYQTKVKLPYYGLWEIRVEADRGKNQYVNSFEIQIPESE